jgi:hypothetical protein
VKYFCNARNAIPYIQGIKIINAFHGRVSDIKTVEEITMKKSRMVADLLAIADVCIEATEAQARLLKSQGKGPVKKKQDNWDVNTIDRGIARIMETTDTVETDSSNLPIKKRRGISITLMTQRSGARSIAPQDTIWKSAKLF